MMHNDLTIEHEQQQPHISTFTSKCDQLHQDKKQLQWQLEQITTKFPVLWPSISDVVKNALEDFSSCALVECCNHIQATYHNLISSNQDLKKILHVTRSPLSYLTTTYANEIEQKMIVSAIKYSIFNGVNEAYTLLQQVHDQSSCLVKKNQLVYPLHSRASQLLNDARNTKDKDQWRIIKAEIDAMEAHIQHIEDDSAKTNQILETSGPWLKHTQRHCRS